MTGRGVALPRAVRRAILAEARSARPRECCGLLVGRGRTVAFAVAMRNVARGTRAYRIADRDHIALRRLLRAWSPRLDIVGVYHSHPAGLARPSATDVAEAHYPEWTHLIVGLGKRAEIRAFRIVSGRARELPIRLISSSV